MPVRMVPAAVAFFVLLLLPLLARAADGSCASAYEQTQLLRQNGKLVEARESARVCARPSCPEIARKDCTEWDQQLLSEIPSVIVIARDEATGDEGGIRVQVDGVERPEASGGRAFELDPGAHVFHIDRSGDEPLAQTVTVLRGERDRALRFVLRSARPRTSTVAAPAPAGDEGQAGDGEPRGEQGSLVPAAIVGGVSVAALGASAWLGLTGRSELSQLRGSCAPSCTDDQVDPVRRRLVASDIALGAGVLGSAVAIYLFAHALSARVVRQAHVDVAPSGRGATVFLGGEF